jgi:hypothetical protein
MMKLKDYNPTSAEDFSPCSYSLKIPGALNSLSQMMVIMLSPALICRFRKPQSMGGCPRSDFSIYEMCFFFF